MFTKICPQCNKEFKADSRRAKYCSKVCANQSLVRKEEKTCPHCGKLFVARPSRKFCSRECVNDSRRGIRRTPPIIKVCLNCGKSFEAPRAIYKFCSRRCADVGKPHPTSFDLSDAERARRSQRSKLMWQDADYRNRMVRRMIEDNPVYKPGVVEKAHKTRLARGSYTNNFKYGNGKISEYEQIVADKLIPLGFYYNYAINTRLARDAFPEANYSHCYKPDFVNLANKLCVEVDGHGHRSTSDTLRDKKKEDCLTYLGFTTIRFTHADIDTGKFDIWLNSYPKNI